MTDRSAGDASKPVGEDLSSNDNTVVKSSDEILAELFGTLKAKPPESIEINNTVPNKTNRSKHHKKNKKHKHRPISHKHKHKSKKNKKHPNPTRKMSSVKSETCRSSSSSDTSDFGNASLHCEDVSVDKDIPLCGENNLSKSLGSIEDTSETLCENSEQDLIRPKQDAQCDRSRSNCNQSKIELSINASVENNLLLSSSCTQIESSNTSLVSSEVSNITVLVGLGLPADDRSSIANSLEERSQIGVPHSAKDTLLEVGPSPPISSEQDEKLQNTSSAVASELMKGPNSESESRGQSTSPPKKLRRRSKDTSPDKSHSHQSSRKRRAGSQESKQRNRSSSRDMDHHSTKNEIKNRDKDNSHDSRKKRSRSRDRDLKARRRRSRSGSRNAHSSDRKRKRSASRDTKRHAGGMKRSRSHEHSNSHHEVSKKQEGSGYSRGKRKRRSQSKSKDRNKRSSSRDITSVVKSSKKEQGKSTTRGKKRSRDRSTSEGPKRSVSGDRKTSGSAKSVSRNQSVEKNIQNTTEKTLCNSSVQPLIQSHDKEYCPRCAKEECKCMEDNPLMEAESQNGNKDFSSSKRDQRSSSPNVDKSTEHYKEGSQTDKKVSSNEVVDTDQTKKNDQGNDASESKRQIHKKKSHKHNRSRSRSIVKDGHRRDKKRSKSTDSHSHRSRRKSRSKSRNKESKKADRRKQSKSKDRYVHRSGRRSRSRSHSRHRTDRIKKSKSKEPEDNKKDKTRSKSKDVESTNRKSRSKSRDKDKSSHRSEKRSRSRSHDRSYHSSRKKRSRSREVHIDKRKLFEIARKNAMSMLKQSVVPFGTENVVAIKAGGKSVEELTDFCKQLSKKEGGVSSDTDEDEEHHSDSDVERPFHHPFQLKERPTNIVLNIRNSVPVPTKTFQEKTAEQSKQLRLQFPVSSGQNHRKTESEWVPVESSQSSASVQSSSIQTSSIASQLNQSFSQTLAQSGSSNVPAAPPSTGSVAVEAADTQSTSTVFPAAPASPPDIGNIVEKRVNAMRKLSANPNDSHAISQIYQVNQQLELG